MRFDILIVGGGHAGAQAAIALRQNGFDGSLAIVGEEPELPYERPPLSKEYLAGAKPFERLLIRPAAFWAERAVVMRLGARVTALDPAGREVETAAGERIGYGRLVWAAGGHARRLKCEGGDLAGVHSIRNRADVDRLSVELVDAVHVVVIGGGYVGLEAAAVLAKRGKPPVMLEAQDRLLARVAGPTLSRFYAEQHAAQGVGIRFRAAVAGLEGVAGRIAAVRLATGERLPCDLAIVGIGLVPSVEPLLAAGAEGDDGVRVDGRGRTSLPDIFAIGDCALHANRFAGGAVLRLESVGNANEMATGVARTLTGGGETEPAVPWFWSTQYDLRLQTVGLSVGYDREVVRGDPAGRAFSVAYLKGDRVVALDCVNATRDYVQGRALVAGARRVDPARLASAASLKELEAEPCAG